ncbi:MAG: glycogen synthase GlgA [Clostridia bacterium]|nr:glycogen synthase GlgA [Clostridia bacterium]
MKILYATSEAYPYAMSGGLADVAGALPKALRRRLVGCRVVMPLYSSIPEQLKADMKFIASITVPVSWRRQYCGIFEAKHDGVTYYLLDNQYYFKREGLYGHYDDAERFAFFSRAVLEILPYIDYTPDIIHCNDWQTAMIPVYLDRFYCHDLRYLNIKTVFTIHNIQYQGKYGYELIGDVLGLPDEDTGLVEYDGCVNLMKAAIECAHRVTTVSPTYANEILTTEYSHGLSPVLERNKNKLCGIVNGIDTVVYDPETDKSLFENFTAENPENKSVNKARLQEHMGLPVKADAPLIGIVSRLVGHKGFDLVKCVFEDMLKAELQVAILGSGDWEFETFFYEMSKKYPNKVAFKPGFIPDLARKIYGGADIFLMPSKSEPCGLAQMIALRYGTIPIVRKTGGLNDTITDISCEGGNGFVFDSYNAHEMLEAVWRAIGLYSDKKAWNALSYNALKIDNGWNISAGEYIKLYKELLS